MKTCPQCEKTYPDSEQFCEADGAALVPMGARKAAGAAQPSTSGARPVECPVCGGKAEPGEAICNFCGARLDTQQQGAAPQGPPPPRPSRITQSTSDEEAPVEEESDERSIYGTLGYIAAALIALAAGIWLALRVSTGGGGAKMAEATPSAIATPAAVSGPMVVLADKVGIHVTGESASAPERDQTAARKVFDDNQAGLLDGYKHSLAGDDTLHDGMDVRLRVMPTGEVTAGAVRVSTAVNPVLDGDAVKAMMGWRFNPFSGSAVEVDYPVVFGRNDAERADIESALSDKLAHLAPAEPAEYTFAVTTPAATPPAIAAAPVETPLALPPPAPPKPERKKRLANLPTPKPSLLKLVQERLRADRKFSRVKAYTNGGVVTLFGKAYNDETKLAVEHAVRKIGGVTDVINTVTTDTADWAANQARIQQQLQNAGLEKVTVKVIGNDAYLDGQVSTDGEKQRAVTITEGAAPVTVRTNLIRVVPPGVLGF